jgi:hypothetical protein
VLEKDIFMKISLEIYSYLTKFSFFLLMKVTGFEQDLAISAIY